MAYQIDDDGTIIRTDDHNTDNNGGNNTLTVILILLLLTAIGFAIGFGVKKSELESISQYLQRQLSTMEDNYYSSERNREATQTKLDKYVMRYSPIVIEDIEVGNGDGNDNMETDYGKRIYSSRTMYLKPQIRYVGYKSQDIILKVKLYNSYGNLSTGDSSPSGYSYSVEKYVAEGEHTITLSGWGNSSKGHWPSGKYRYEIWYGDVCLATKSFTIY